MLLSLLTIYFSLGLLIGVFDILLIYKGKYKKYTFKYILDVFLMDLFVWPFLLLFFIIAMVIIKIKYKNKE